MKNHPDPAHHRLQLQVRALWCAVALLCVAATAANVRPLQVSNADNTPTTTVSLSGPRWTGTLDAARLPAVVPLRDGNGAISAPGGFATGYGVNVDAGGAGRFSSLGVDGVASLANGNVSIDGTGVVQVHRLSVGANSVVTEDGEFLGSSLSTSNGITTDSDNLYTDGCGNLFAQGLNASGAASIGGDLNVGGSLDGSELIVAGNPIADGDGYVWTGSQLYNDGVVTPTGYLAFKDATGSVYFVPAVAR